MLLADQGYVSQTLQADLLQHYNVHLLAKRRKNQKTQYSVAFTKALNKLRRRIETTLSQLTEQFYVSRLRARTHWGFRTRMSNKFAGFTLGVFLNQCLGRPLMALKDVVFA